jgi:hypothetical protein
MIDLVDSHSLELFDPWSLPMSLFQFVLHIGLGTTLILSMAVLCSTPVQAWDPDFELMPYEASRATEPIRDVVIAPPVSQNDYHAYADETWFSGSTYLGGYSGGQNQYLAALRAARYYRLLDDPAFAQAAIDAVVAATAYITAAGSKDPGFGRLSRAARVYTLLRDGTAAKPSGWEASVYAWLVALWDELPPNSQELGAMNRAIGVGMAAEAMVELCAVTLSDCTTTTMVDAESYADEVWSAWYTYGTIPENSSNYFGLDMQFLTWWLELSPSRSSVPSAPLTDPKLLALAERTLAHFTNLGPSASYGDTVGFGAGSYHYIGTFEKWASAMQDGRFRWAAQRLFGYVSTRQDDMAQWGNIANDVADAALVAAIVLDEEAAPGTTAISPKLGSEALFRGAWKWNSVEIEAQNGPGFEAVPGTIADKVVFRTGWTPDGTTAVVAASRQGPHGHPDAGALNAYVSNGSQLLNSNGYTVKDAYYHNTLSIEAPSFSAPARSTWRNGPRTPGLTGEPGAVHVTFSAKSISGSQTIGVFRPQAAATARVEITDEWETYTIDQVYYDDDYRAILFSPMFAYDKSSNQPVDAEFLIDDVSLTIDGSPPGSSFPVAYDFDSDLEGWLVADQHHNTQTLECSYGLKDDTTCAIEVTHETTDTANGAGAMRVSFDVGYRGDRNTPGATITDFAADGDFGYTSVWLPGHLGLPFDARRHVIFLGELGIWVRDEVRASGDAEAKVGPGWHFAAIADEDAVDGWVVGAQTAIAIPTLAGPLAPAGRTFLMHWENRAKDLLVKFHTYASDAVMQTADASSPPAEDTPGGTDVRTPFDTRVSLEVDRSFTSGEFVVFNSFLLPHSPVVDAEPLADSITWLVDQNSLGIVEIQGAGPGEVVLLGLNSTGGCVDVPGYALSTDARVFRVGYGSNGINAYDLVSGKTLGEDGCQGTDADSLVSLATKQDVHHRGLPNLAINSELTGGIDDWSVSNGGSTGTAIVDLSADNDALLVEISNAVGDSMPKSHQSGVFPVLTTMIGENESISIEFDAALVSSTPIAINAQRIWGGSTRQSVPIDSTWGRYRLSFDQSYAAAQFLLSAILPSATGSWAQLTQEASFLLDNVIVRNIPNQALNPGFNGSSTSSWSGIGTAAISLEETDIIIGSALRVVIPDPGTGSPPTSWQSGAQASTIQLPAHSRIRVTFDAKSIAESNCVVVRRPWVATPGDEITLTGAWKKYTVEFDHLYAGTAILFNVCDSNDGAEFLIDNLIATVVENRSANGRFDDDLGDWHGIFDGEPTDALDQETGPGAHLYWNPDPTEPDAPTLLVRTHVDSGPPTAGTSGAVAVLQDSEVVEGGAGLHVSFTARSVSGSTLLRVGIAGDPSAASEVVSLSGTATHYAVDLDDAQGDVLFSSTDSSGLVDEAEVILDNVVITSRR